MKQTLNILTVPIFSVLNLIKRDRQGYNIDTATHDKQPDPEFDEFGRSIPAKKASDATSIRQEWPPCFCDKHAADFVLDTRSGMFYHAISSFFYDPKSKLYYGNKQRLYYRFDEADNRRFVAVEEQDTSTRVDTSEPEAILDPSNRPSSSSTSSTISIKLKTKKLPTTKKFQSTKHPRAASAIATSSAALPKEVAQTIGKWEERRQEQEQEPVPTGPTTARTKDGEPVCLLCKRKFPTIDKLKRHEQVSQLHRDNLLRSKKLEPVATATQYVDRAHNRRSLYGDAETVSSSTITSTTGTVCSMAESGIAPTGDPVSEAFDPLGSQNIGRKLLHGMGWSQDYSDRSSQTHGGISKEWDRIENNITSNQQRIYHSENI